MTVATVKAGRAPVTPAALARLVSDDLYEYRDRPRCGCGELVVLAGGLVLDLLEVIAQAPCPFCHGRGEVAEDGPGSSRLWGRCPRCMGRAVVGERVVAGMVALDDRGRVRVLGGFEGPARGEAVHRRHVCAASCAGLFDEREAA